ncbi:MAG: methyl coenzyme M reductase system, component A2 [Methanocalculus sp. MSAO_Arc1]|uniref:methyl coenzyme M reductase system, component A2 n=1 Tax=Methanocalculus TaxID=71151 RepID=UPI000FF65B04|nr:MULTISPECIES: methyl coenzyme M reductase system, component A2 [unclassified Methanocalculus]MCP1662721.1 methyl coenzyme M reductase system subunit A2 [Methanocalculus sp. AMF5]RQD79967.1 MAG: methyl coenzyme M reductase system, component A2 [Methanocalculus sp. MSAO_Arc1]
MKPFITVENLCMDFNGTRVLSNINLEFAEGETVGIIGRSGAGKTVLIHLIRGIDQPPTEGRIIYHISTCDACNRIELQSAAGSACPRCPGGTLQAKDVDLWNDDEQIRRSLMKRTAIMFQRTFALYGNDRVIENVMKALEDTGYPSGKAVSRAADLLDEVRLSHRMMHIARDLSGGEKQRVVLARQLAKEPFLLFADEPTGTLDPKMARVVHEMLKEAASSATMGMIITSHFAQAIEDVADRAILIADGEITATGTPTEVIATFMKEHSDGEVFNKVETGNALIRSDNLKKRYISVDRGVIRAVDGVTFDIKEKEIFGIIGTSGAGKTTLSRMIAGILEPTSGKLEIQIGEDWIDMGKPGYQFRGRAKTYIGLLHQEYDLFPHRTVLDNLTDSIGLEFPKELAIRKAMITLKMAGFTEEKGRAILNRQPNSLSEGERHRVALAQVLIREPRIIILDEPTGTMDPITKVDVKHSILHAREEMEETFVIVAHDMEFVSDICDRAALMRGGKIVAIGPTQEIMDLLTSEEKDIMSQAQQGE